MPDAAKIKGEQVDDSNDCSSFESSSESDFPLQNIAVTQPDVVPELERTLKVDTANRDISSGHWSITLNTGFQDILFKIDTGALVNVLLRNQINS